MNQKIFDRLLDKVIPEPNSGCWLWVGVWDSSGYGHMKISRKTLSVHRLSWEFHNGPAPRGLCVLHKCDTPCCVNPTHLFLGTNKDNTQDCIKKNRRASYAGENNGRAKLSNAQVETIRLLLSFGHSYKSIAERFGISESNVYHIKAGERWQKK